MNICLIRPTKLMVAGTLTPPPFAPLGMAYIAGALRAAGHNVTVLDAMGEKIDQYTPLDIPVHSARLGETKFVGVGLTPAEILERIPANTELIGFSCMFSSNWLADRHLINYLSEKLPHIPFIAGGESISGMPEVIMQQAPGIKVCVIGEGEETVVDLADAFEKKRPLMEVTSIVYQQNGQYIKTARRNRVKNLEQIAPPAWEMFPIDNYEKLDVAGWNTARKTLPLMATRGCPYSCTFCTSPDMWGTRYYMRAPTHVAAEIEYLMERFGVNNFDFYDLTAIIKKEWIKEFAQIIIDRKLDITWRIPAGTRSEAIDAEIAGYLYRSGCWGITYAPESGSIKMLKLIKKKVKIPNMLASMRYSYQEKMQVYANMILGLPDEKHVDVWKTIWFLIRCTWVGITDMNMAIFRPYPGSALFDRLVKEGKIHFNNDDFLLETTLNIETMWENTFYNDHISKSWYQFYNIVSMAAFHGTNYLFRPVRFFRAVRNIATNRPETRFEWKFGHMLRNKFTISKKKELPQAAAA